MQIKNLITLPGLLGISSAALVQIGFDASLNYDFVSANPTTQAQIFQLLPQGVAFALGIAADAVPVQSLQPLDTSADLGYITTLAVFDLDDALVDQLRLDIVSPTSPLYNNPDAAVHELVSHINPNIPLLA